MNVRTKIVATLGPASDTPAVIRRLVEAGCDTFRINFSHGSPEQRQALLESVRAVEAELERPLAVIGDLCGPKIRVGPLTEEAVELDTGARVDILRDAVVGDAHGFSTTLPELVDELSIGEPVLLDDGRIRLEVESVIPGERARCRVIHGGPLRPGKGVNLPRTRLSLSSLTEKDRADVDWIVGRELDFVALSFVREASALSALRELLRAGGSAAHVIAKVEKPQALERIDEIVAEADAVMVARGDLGVEMDLPEVPLAQKRIAELCQTAGKPCIIATQMLETMTHSPQPTRAEVSDVANAVLDRADAVMLSGETAVGEYPVRTVRMMNRIAARAESYAGAEVGGLRITDGAWRTAAALAGAVHAIVEGEEIAAVAVFTATGATARMLSKSRLPLPILALTQHRSAARRMQLYHGVIPALAAAPEHTREVLALASRLAMDRGIATPGDKLVVVSGRPIGVTGATNTMVVHRVTR
jgi:pyruvate kinase